MTDTSEPNRIREISIMSYWSGQTRASRRARRFRMIMVIAAIASLQVASILILHPVVAINSGQTLLGGGAMGTPFAPLDTRLREQGQQNAYLPKALVYLALFLGTQWLFLCPRGGWRIRLSTEGPPPFKSALAAGFIGMLLSIGLLATLMEIPNWWLALTTE